MPVNDFHSMAGLPLQLPLDGMTAQLLRLSPPSKPAVGTPGGQTPKQNRALWYALYFPQLQTLPGPRQKTLLRVLAGMAESISSTVSFHPQALVCEVRSSLKYFGGMEAIHDRLEKLIGKQLLRWQLEPAHFLYAAAPTVSGSLLLARAGYNVLVYRKDNLRAALGQLPAEVLQLDRDQSRRLYNMGVRRLRDIWRLPVDGLRKRFGSDFVNRLDRALGKAPEPTCNYLPPPLFKSRLELSYGLENLSRLLPAVDELLARLCNFLQRRDLCTGQLKFTLHHERRDHTPLHIGLRQPGRGRGHFMTLVETYFSRLNLPAPVTAVSLEVNQFDACITRSLSLPGHHDGDRSGDTSLNCFMEQLRARLGANSLSGIMTVAEHCPEYAGRQPDYDEPIKAGTAAGGSAVAANPRPLWLLPRPHRLTVRNGKLYHRKSITLISGPERIETRWWSGREQCRDYYLARDMSGSRLWLYRDRRGGRHWFLHGYFA